LSDCRQRNALCYGRQSLKDWFLGREHIAERGQPPLRGYPLSLARQKRAGRTRSACAHALRVLQFIIQLIDTLARLPLPLPPPFLTLRPWSRARWRFHFANEFCWAKRRMADGPTPLKYGQGLV